MPEFYRTLNQVDCLAPISDIGIDESELCIWSPQETLHKRLVHAGPEGRIFEKGPLCGTTIPEESTSCPFGRPTRHQTLEYSQQAKQFRMRHGQLKYRLSGHIRKKIPHRQGGPRVK